MSNPHPPLSELLKVAVEASQIGGEILLSWRDRITAREKSPRDAATIAKTPKNRFASVNPFGRRTTARRGCGRRTVTGLPVGR